MQVNIEVDELQFKELMEKNLSSLPKEKIKEIILDGLRSYLCKEDTLKNIFFRRASGYYSNEFVPSPFLENILKNTHLTKVTDSIIDELVCILRTKYESILRAAISDLICDAVGWSGSLRKRIQMEIIQYENTKNNN